MEFLRLIRLRQGARVRRSHARGLGGTLAESKANPSRLVEQVRNVKAASIVAKKFRTRRHSAAVTTVLRRRNDRFGRFDGSELAM